MYLESNHSIFASAVTVWDYHENQQSTNGWSEGHDPVYKNAVEKSDVGTNSDINSSSLYVVRAKIIFSYSEIKLST